MNYSQKIKELCISKKSVKNRWKVDIFPRKKLYAAIHSLLVEPPLQLYGLSLFIFLSKRWEYYLHCAEIEMILVYSNNFLAENIRNIVIWNLVILYALGGKKKKIISKIIEATIVVAGLQLHVHISIKKKRKKKETGKQLSGIFNFSFSFFNWICNAKACNPLSTHSQRLAATKFLGYSAKSP